jgi:hypothetical protein
MRLGLRAALAEHSTCQTSAQSQRCAGPTCGVGIFKARPSGRAFEASLPSG